jgi:sulfide:quinone oxidoreductase
MKTITVIGSGFAALTATRRLRALDASLDITLIAPRPEFIYYPSLIWIPSGLRKGEDLRIDLRAFLLRNGIRFHQGEVTGLEAGGRRVVTKTGTVVNDGLIIASGARFIKQLPGVEQVILPCEGIAAAEAIRDRIQALSEGVIAVGFASNPQEPSALRGGPLFEFLLGQDTLLRRQGRRNRFKLVFFSPASQPGQRLGAKAVERLFGMMHDRRIETHLGHKLKGFEANKVSTDGGEIPADLILFMPGLTGSDWFDATDLPRSPGGLLKADAHCRVQGWDKVYVAGDSGSFPGPEWMPKQARMANRQARTAAANLLLEVAGKLPERTFKVGLMCIVDSLEDGMLVMRTPKRTVSLPPLRLMHHVKRLYEGIYLRPYR